MVAQIKVKPDEKIIYDIVDAMTTNESFFFRDGRPFEMLKNYIIPELLKTKKDKKIRVWSAACSSGQEPYSMAMTFDQMPSLKGYDIEIIATDISKTVLEKAQKGVYTQFEVQRGLPITHLVKYFDQVDKGWQIKQTLKDKVKFREFNLLDNPRVLGTMDIIFCRNVLIYFDKETKQQIFKYLQSTIDPEGFLVLGGSETILGLTSEFSTVTGQRGLYALKSKEALSTVS